MFQAESNRLESNKIEATLILQAEDPGNILKNLNAFSHAPSDVPIVLGLSFLPNSGTRNPTRRTLLEAHAAHSGASNPSDFSAGATKAVLENKTRNNNLGSS